MIATNSMKNSFRVRDIFLTFVVVFVIVVAVVMPPQAYAQGRGRGRGAPPASRPAPPVSPVPPVAVPPPVRGIPLQKAVPGQLPRGYQEPAFARGYADGFTLGRGDNRGSKRYDPVGH